jgi:hypothetical protein
LVKLAYQARPTVLMGENLGVLPMSLQGTHDMNHPDLGSLTPNRGRALKKEDRIPQWGFHETKEFIAIRAELEKDFTQTKRNKTLWELIERKMKEKGYRRSADQCKCKWKNLVNRYKVNFLHAFYRLLTFYQMALLISSPASITTPSCMSSNSHLPL